MVTLIVLASIFAYAVMAGGVGKRAQITAMRRCRYATHRSCEHGVTGVFSGIFWPVVLPVFLGVLLGENDKQTRLEACKQKELEQAEHDSRIARERRVEAEEISRQLRAIGKDV